MGGVRRDVPDRPGDGPALGPPEGLVPHLQTVGRTIAEASARLGRRVEVDPLQILAERSAITGFTRQRDDQLRRRDAACCRCYDDWVGVSLTRPDDWDLVPAWLEHDDVVEGWDSLASWSASVRPTSWCCAPGGSDCPSDASASADLDRSTRGPVGAVVRAPPTGAIEDLVVVDLTALWAGPRSSATCSPRQEPGSSRSSRPAGPTVLGPGHGRSTT